MASGSNNQTSGTKTRDQYVTEAVESKRKILDNEIVAFREVKDQEFRAFEAYLRHKPGNPTVANAETHIDNLGLRHKMKRLKSTRRVNQNDTARPKQRSDENAVRNGHVGFVGEGTLGPVEEAARMRIEGKPRSEMAEPELEAIWELMQNDEHDRERDFQGVITPSYLPLLEERGDVGEKENEDPNRIFDNLHPKGKNIKPELTGKESKGEKRKDTAAREKLEADIEQARRAASTDPAAKKQLEIEIFHARLAAAPGSTWSLEECDSPGLTSSGKEQMEIEMAYSRQLAASGSTWSLESGPPALTSPSVYTSRPIPSSVLRESGYSLYHRRSSSRSDVSIDGLRSSLKDPSQPKSPKRVQFSIDNTVVSPSTSPLARRPKAGADSHNEWKGNEKFEVVKGKRDGKSSPNGPSDDEAGSSSSGPKLNGSIGGMSSFGSYFHSKYKESDGTTAGGDDFDILDNEDDVFAFDEDVSARTSGKQKETGAGDIIEDDIEEDVGNAPPLTGSSPHAGSLPIEIRMPARRGREADDG